MIILLYILHEDSENSITTNLLYFLRDYSDSFIKEFEIKAFNGIIALRKYVQTFDFSVHNNDKFVIIFDNVKDNQAVKSNTDIIFGVIKDKKYKNVIICDILCIEYLLLTHKKFKNLMIANKLNRERKDLQMLLSLRVELIKCVSNKIDWRLNNLLVSYVENEIVIKQGFNKAMSTEKLAYFLLKDLVKKSNFNMGKTLLNDCWTEACCNSVINKNNKTGCYFYGKQITKAHKANSFLECTYFNNINKKVKSKFKIG